VHAANQLYAVAEDAAVQAAATAAATTTASSSGGGGPVDLLANAFESLLSVSLPPHTAHLMAECPAWGGGRGGCCGWLAVRGCQQGGGVCACRGSG
jgi:hypothetical protein